jgi:thioredoxin-dependent peroxiredoxin
MADEAKRSAPRMPRVGELAPDFTALTQDEMPLALRDLRGRSVVLYFYPKDDTPG